MQKELAEQKSDLEVKQEILEKKRKRTEQTDEDITYLFNGNELFVSAPGRSRLRNRRGWEVLRSQSISLTTQATIRLGSSIGSILSQSV